MLLRGDVLYQTSVATEACLVYSVTHIFYFMTLLRLFKNQLYCPVFVTFMDNLEWILNYMQWVCTGVYVIRWHSVFQGNNVPVTNIQLIWQSFSHMSFNTHSIIFHISLPTQEVALPLVSQTFYLLVRIHFAYVLSHNICSKPISNSAVFH